jgi:hypothetical protein
VTEATDILAAEARAAAARQRLTATVGELQERLAPQALAKDAVETLSDAGRKALDSGVETAKANPALVAGGAAALLAFFGRKRLWSLVRRKK